MQIIKSRRRQHCDNLGFEHPLLKYDVAIKCRLPSVNNCISFLGLLVELKPLQTRHLNLIGKYLIKNSH